MNHKGIGVRERLSNAIHTGAPLTPVQRKHVETLAEDLNCSISEALRVIVEDHRIRYERTKQRGN